MAPKNLRYFLRIADNHYVKIFLCLQKQNVLFLEIVKEPKIKITVGGKNSQVTFYILSR